MRQGLLRDMLMKQGPTVVMPDNSKTFYLKQHGRIADIPASSWDACVSDFNPFISHAFLSALEESGSTRAETGWFPQHISFSQADGEIEAVIPAYLKLHSYGEYVFDQAWAEALGRAGGNYYPKLQICVPFSPVTGARFLRHSRSHLSIEEMGNALKKVMTSFDLSSVHVTFCQQSEWERLAQSDWLQRIGMQFHWQNEGYQTFDDFLAALSSSHRKSIKRERREAQGAGLVFKILRGDDIKAEYWDAFYQFYQNTVDRKWGEAYLTRDFFTLLSQKMANQIVLIMAFDGATPIAGALNLVGGDTLYGRNWGCIGQWPFLHFELCYYRALDFAIENGLKRVEAGAQGEHKVQRGYLPQMTYSAHFLAHKGLSRAVSDFLVQEGKMIAANRDALLVYSPFRKTGL
jgi:predicted N-acyltransferase